MTPFPLLELPQVELQAMCLDGECYRLGEGFLPIAVAPSTAARASAALGTRSPRLIAARATAAWVWRAAEHYPITAQYLVDLEARWRPAPGARLDVIESVIRPGDVVRFGAAAVTTPLRTAIDLVRFGARFGATESDTVRRLALLGGFGLADALGAMDRGRNLSGKREATRRLRHALSPS